MTLDTQTTEGTKMNTDRTMEQAVEKFFVVATVASIAGSAVLGGALDGPDYLARGRAGGLRDVTRHAPRCQSTS